MASKVNTKFVVLLVGGLLSLALGVGALAAYSLRMSGERNIAAGDALVAQAREARAAGNEEAAIEFINDAASQYGRAVNKDRSRRDWLMTWRDTLLETVPETDVEYQVQYTQRYLGALDRLASLNPSAPGPQIELLLKRDELQRLSRRAGGLLEIENEIERRVQSLDADSPAAVRLQALRGLARTDRASLENVDASARDEAEEWMSRFYTQFMEDEEAFTAPPSDDVDSEEFGAAARRDHARVALGLVRAVINKQAAATAEGRSQDALRQLGVAIETINRIMNDNEQYANDARFLGLRTDIRRNSARAEISNPSQQRAAIQAILDEDRAVIFDSLASTAPDDLPLEEMWVFANWYASADDKQALAQEVERAIDHADTDARTLRTAGRLLAQLDQPERALEVFRRIQDMPTPPLSLDGMLLPDIRIQGLAQQVKINLDLRQLAIDDDDESAADEYLAAAVAARDTLEENAGVGARRFLLRADADVAIARNEGLEAIRLLEALRSEFGGTPEVLVDLANQLIEQGTTGEAKQLLEELVSNGFRSPSVVLTLSGIYRGEGDLEGALQLLQSESRRSSTPEAYTGPIARIQQLLDIEQGGAGGDPLLAALIRAEEMIARRDLEGATQAISRLLERQPDAVDNLRVGELLAQIDLMSGNRDAGLARLQRILAVDPDNQRIQRVLRQLESEDPVADRLAEIDASDRPDIDKALLRYQVLLSNGRVDDAAADMDLAEQLDPNHPEVINVRFSSAVNNGDLTEAGRLAARAEAANVDGVDGLLYLGRLQMAKGEQTAAVRTLRTAAGMIPSSVQIRRYLGLALLQAGQIDVGLDSLRRAYEARRDNLLVLNDYVGALRQLGRNAEARAVLDPKNDPTAPARSMRSITNLWLSLEALEGNQARALEERRTYFRADMRSDAMGDSAEARENARVLIELLVNDDELEEAEQVLASVRDELTDREANRAETLIAIQRASQLENPEESSAAVQAAITGLRDEAAAESAQTNDPAALQDAARFALNAGLYDLGMEILGSAVQYESSEGRSVSREIARRKVQRAATLDRESQILLNQAQQLDASDPIAAETLRERAAQRTDRATVSREEAARVYADMLAGGVQDEDFVITLDLAELLLQTDELDRASEMVQQVRTARADNLIAMLLAAQIAERRGDRTEASRLFNRAVESHPTDFRAFFQRARFNSDDAARRSDVLADLRRVNDLRPSLVEGWGLRFQVLMQSGDSRAAYSVLREGISKAPSIADSLARVLVQALVREGNVDEAYNASVERAEADPSSLEWNYTAGWYALQRGANTEAVRYFDIVMQNPEVADEPIQHGQAAVALLKAKLQAEQVVSLQELNRLARLMQAVGYEGASGVTRAMLLARAFAAIPSERSQAESLIGQAYKMASEPSDDASTTQKIQAWFGELPAIVGSMSEAYDYVVRLDEFIRNQKQENAEAEIQPPLFIRLLVLEAARERGGSPSDLIPRATAMLAEPENDATSRFRLHKLLSNLSTDVGDIESATQYGLDALAIDPNDLDMLNNVAFFLAKYLDRAPEALPLAERASQLAPRNPIVLDTVGVVYLMNGNAEQAIPFLERSRDAARTQEQRLPANLHLAEALIELGDLANAERHLRDAERLLPVVVEGMREAYAGDVSRVRQLLDSR